MTSIIYTYILKRDYINLSNKSGNYRIVSYYENGNIKEEHYFVNGKLHREGNKPAFVRYYENGKVRNKYYYINGSQHRENGPIFEYYGGEKSSEEFYYLFGIPFSGNEYYSEKISLIRKILSETKDLDLKQKLFQSMFEDS